ncbi:MAG: Ig-like domain-containing protein [Planctomycetota bacterium]
MKNHTTPLAGRLSLGAKALGLAFLLLPTGCDLSSSNSSGGMIGTEGELMVPPGGGDAFFVDQNQGGGASRIRVEEMFWGRQVDVYGLDRTTGLPETTPRFTDFVVNENIQSQPANFVLETNPITQETRIVIQRDTETATGEVNPTFANLVRSLESGMPPIAPKHYDGSDAPPFSFLARNATLVLRFSDLLDDSAQSLLNLPFTVQVLQGYPPTIPFTPRMTFDRGHGGLRDGEFHSTRILIDMSITEAEAIEFPGQVPVNTLGLPASLVTTSQPNVALRIPTRESAAVGQFTILRSVTGKPVAPDGNGPVVLNGTTNPIVRALRSGNSTDQNNGFTLDLNTPEIVGEWPIQVSNVSALDPDVDNESTLFSIRVNFQNDCKNDASIGDILQVGTSFLEVLAPNGLSGGSNNQLNDLQVRSLSGRLLTADVQGPASFLSTFDPNLFAGAQNQCWLSITPLPTNNQLAPDSTVQIRFSEPMDPASIQPFDTMLLVRDTVSTDEPGAEEIVIAEVNASDDLQRFTSQPLLPLDGPDFHLRLLGDTDGVIDLAGNPLAAPLPFVPLAISGVADPSNGGFVMRFNETDELRFDGSGTATADGFNDLRGQFFYDLNRGVIRPRPVTHTAYPADRNNAVPSVMVPFPPGIQTPLSPLGSKLQAVWRYCDLGFNVFDETVYNLDVEGLSWAPVGGNIVSDFYTDFEIRLAHSNRLPDEVVNQNLLPDFPNSGLRAQGQQYTLNIAPNDGALNANIQSAQKTVHPRALGYQVSPIELFVASSGTRMIPFPLNKNVNIADVYYTWRDTTMSVRSAPSGSGIPLAIEADNDSDPNTNPNAMDSTLNLYPENGRGTLASAGQVPSIGLPLLMEYRCYPSNTGIGLNAFDVSLAINSSARPNFRAYSTGGTNTQGNQISKDPNLELTPTGGFNPTSTPPGAPTAQVADNTFYIGQLDTVTRVSIVHSIWLNAGTASNWLEPIFEPRAEDQPTGTQVRFDYRGATGMTNAAQVRAFNADPNTIDMYGNLYNTNGTIGVGNAGITFTNGNNTWLPGVVLLDGSQFVQVRMAFINNVETGLNAELSAFGIAYLRL